MEEPPREPVREGPSSTSPVAGDAILASLDIGPFPGRSNNYSVDSAVGGL